MPKILLRERSAAAIVRAVAGAAERWSDADFPPRVRATQAIATRTGYSLPVVEYALDRLFFPLRGAALSATIDDELGSLAALDGFVERAGRPAAFARGVDHVAIVASDTTIGVALIPALFALCAKCDVVVKDRSDALVRAFFATLVDELPEFLTAATARAWTGGDDPDEDALLARADVVVAFGGDDALRAIRSRVRPDARFVPFGHRASIGFLDLGAQLGTVAGNSRVGAAVARFERAPFAVGAEGPPSGDGNEAQSSYRVPMTLLDAIAADALLYDGDGCLSLHALFVGGGPAEVAMFASDLAAAFERVSIEFPAGVSDPHQAASVAAYRNLSAFRAASGRGAVYAPAAASATIALDPPRDAPPPFLPRVLPVFRVTDAAEAIAYVRAHRLPIQALGVADPCADGIRAFAEAVGAVRIARLGEMQAPPVGSHHGGAPRIVDFVRWIDCE